MSVEGEKLEEGSIGARRSVVLLEAECCGNELFVDHIAKLGR